MINKVWTLEYGAFGRTWFASKEDAEKRATKNREYAEKRATKNSEYAAIVPTIKSHDFPVINNAQDLCDLLNVLNA